MLSIPSLGVPTRRNCRMKVTQRQIDSVRPYPNNPRKTGPAVDAVAESIRRFGFRQPIVVDSDGVIIAGHVRYEAALKLAIEKVPVHVATDMTPEQVRAYRIADNKTGELAEWDAALLAGELGEIDPADLDWTLLGFGEGELRSLLGSSDEQSPGNTPVDDVPDTPAKPITRHGDLWILGEHRLLCGDSTRLDDVKRLMDGHLADLVSTDPPYLVNYTGDRGKHPDNGRPVGKDWSGVYKEIEIKDALGFFRDLYRNILAVSRKNAALYMWHSHTRYHEIHRIWTDLGILPHQLIVWVKPTPVWGHLAYLIRHEPCLMGWLQGNRPEMLEMPPDESSSVWELGWEGGKKRCTDGVHPTQKPIEIFARPMRKHTKPGAVCFEPFSGSGSQIIAGETEGRRVFAMEISPTFVDVAVNRWQQFTGRQAELIRPDEAARQEDPHPDQSGTAPGQSDGLLGRLKTWLARR